MLATGLQLAFDLTLQLIWCYFLLAMCFFLSSPASIYANPGLWLPCCCAGPTCNSNQLFLTALLTRGTFMAHHGPCLLSCFASSVFLIVLPRPEHLRPSVIAVTIAGVLIDMFGPQLPDGALGFALRSLRAVGI